MQFGGTVTYEYKGHLRSIELKWFDSREEYVEKMAQWLADSPDFQPKRWWQFWRTQVCSADVLQRYSEIAA